MNYFTTIELMERYLSSFGVVAFSDHDDDGAADELVVEDCIGEATRVVKNMLCRRYGASDLEGNLTAQDLATVLACRCLCLRRGNGVPDSLEMRYQEVLAYLRELGSGKEKICGLPAKPGGTPVWSNLSVWRGYGDRKVGVVREASDRQTSKRPQNTVPPDRGYLHGR